MNEIWRHLLISNLLYK